MNKTHTINYKHLGGWKQKDSKCYWQKKQKKHNLSTIKEPSFFYSFAFNYIDHK